MHSLLKPYNSTNYLPFPLYIKESMPIIFEALIELERIRPANPVEFFAAFILNKNGTDKKELISSSDN